MTAAIRPAATVILWRGGAQGPRVLMGQRGAGAAFMPSKFVFPGGALDAADADDADAAALVRPECLPRLGLEAAGCAPQALAAAAVRELGEETGLTLRAPGSLRFVFRAVTPPGRSRRFDARFFLAPAAALAGDADALAGSGELTSLTWLALTDARALDLPFVTEVALAEAAALLGGGQDAGVAFFDNRGDRPVFRRLI